MFENAVIQSIHERRSIRKYTNEPILKHELEVILNAGRMAPSGMNNQPWRFLVIHKQDPRHAALAGISKYGKIIAEANVLIAVFLNKADGYHTIKDHQVAGAAIQNMLLAAHSLGFGTVWLGEIINHGEEPFKIMNVDSNTHEFMTLITIGKPAEAGLLKRKPLEHFMLEPLS